MFPIVKAKRKVVLPYLAQPFQPRGQGNQIQRPRMFVNLHGIPSAEAHRGAIAPLQPREFVPSARRAGGVAFRHGALTNRPMPQIRPEDLSPHARYPPRQNLERFHRLNRTDQAGHRTQHAGRLAGGLHSAGRLGINAAEAGSVARQHGHRNPITPHSSPVEPGNPLAYRVIVYQEARFEVIGTIQDYICPAQQVVGVRRIQVRNKGFKVHAGIGREQMPPGRFRLWQTLTRVVFRIEDLALQVALLHVIPIDQPQRADSGPRQQRRLHRAQRTAPHNDRGGRREVPLPFLSERRVANLPAEAFPM